MLKNRVLFVVGLLSLLLVAMAVSRPLAKAPTSAKLSWPPRPVIVPAGDKISIERGREADVARWTAMGEYYQNLAIRQRGLKADSARWTTMAKYYQNISKVQQGRVADALRLTAMAKYYMQAISATS